ncbi:MAG: hypothetical protein WAV55_05345 [Clostridiaceae bacterium]
MKKTSSLVLITLIMGVLSGCTLFQNNVTTPNRSDSTTAGGLQDAVTTPVTTPVTTTPTIPETVPGTTAITTEPVTTTTLTIAPATSTPKTKPITKPPTTKPSETKPPVTKPPATKGQVTKVPTVQSNLPKNIKAELDQSGNGFIIIYQPLKYKDIVAVTAWNVVTFDTKSQLLLVTKKKGSLVQVYDTKLTKDQQDRVINDVIRDWTTTGDYEVIRIRYSDPETMTMNFIKVTEPGGKKTITDIKSSMIGLPNWEAFEYD